MKITNDTRINAVIFAQKDKELVLFSQHQNMTVGEYLEKSLPHFLLNSDRMPNPFDILDFEFDKHNEYKNEFGHTFTSLVCETSKGVCSVIKLDLATS